MNRAKSILLRRRYPDLVFWVSFLVLNAFLFLPLYLLNVHESSLFPLEPAMVHTPGDVLISLLIWRENPDPFRVNLELPILIAPWVNVGWIRRGLFRWLVMILYFIALCYYLYESVMISLYRFDPVFYNHYFLIKDGLGFLLDNLNLSVGLYLAAGASAVALLLLVIWAVRVLVDWQIPNDLSRVSRMALAALAISLTLSALAYNSVLADPRMVVSSLAFKIEQNISASLAMYQDIANFDDREIRETYDYSAHKLIRKPNIYLLFIESYGSVLYKRPDWREAYLKILDRAEKTLTKHNFHFASALSESPTWGGGSWLAYTSALFGIRIDNHPQYLSLFDRYQLETPRYPDLGAYLRSQGYYYLWVTSLSVELKDSMWEKYIRFYGVDRWLRYRDLNYQGQHYGWGPAPADQYVLSYARDEALKEVDQPILLFYITQNSHYPWDPLPEVVDDWRTLATDTGAEDMLPREGLDHQEVRQNYLHSIEYEIDMLVRFMLDHADEDAIFVLVGDHQPPRVSRRADSYDTPVHIVSRDPAFIAGLEQYGLRRGHLDVPDEKPQLRHEGLYSLLARALVERYGTAPHTPPEYLPAGAALPDWAKGETAE